MIIVVIVFVGIIAVDSLLWPQLQWQAWLHFAVYLSTIARHRGRRRDQCRRRRLPRHRCSCTRCCGRSCSGRHGSSLLYICQLFHFITGVVAISVVVFFLGIVAVVFVAVATIAVAGMAPLCCISPYMLAVN